MKITCFFLKHLIYVIHAEFQVRGGNHSLCLFGVFDPSGDDAFVPVISTTVHLSVMDPTD